MPPASKSYSSGPLEEATRIPFVNHPVKAPKKLIEVAIPQEAQRLGLEAFALDLNPEADLINNPQPS
jgi:hypothetical protein